MPLRRPETFYSEGSKVFKKAPTNRATIQGWVTIAGGKAKAALNPDNDTSTRLSCAYDAVFNLSLAVLNSKGWRCGAADGHHAQSLEAACAFAGVTETIFFQMDAVRDLRNSQYDGVPPTEEDVKLAVAAMNRLVPVLLELLKAVL